MEAQAGSPAPADTKEFGRGFQPPCAGSKGLAGLQELPVRDVTMFLFLCFDCYDSQVTRGWGSERDVSRSANPGLLHPSKLSPSTLTPPMGQTLFP